MCVCVPCRSLKMSKDEKKSKKEKKRERTVDGQNAAAMMDPDGRKWALDEEKKDQRNETFVQAAKREVSARVS